MATVVLFVLPFEGVADGTVLHLPCALAPFISRWQGHVGCLDDGHQLDGVDQVQSQCHGGAVGEWPHRLGLAVTPTEHLNALKGRFMQRIAMVFCLTLSISPMLACAGMSLVGETKESIIYINLDAAEKNGDLLKAEGSQDFHQQQQLDGHTYLSAKFIHEFDCSKKQVRQLALSIYPENMANGGALLNDQQAKEWTRPAPGTAQAMMLNKACPAK